MQRRRWNWIAAQPRRCFCVPWIPTLRGRWTLLAALAAAAWGLAVGGVPARAATYTWNNADGNWSVAANWTGGAPQSAPDTILVFGGSGAAGYNSVNDLANAPTLINQLVITSTSTATGLLAPTISVNSIRFGGLAPRLTLTDIGDFNIDVPVDIASTLFADGNGSGAVTLNRTLTGAAGIVKSGTSDFRLGTAGDMIPSLNTFHGGFTIHEGTFRFNNNSDSGRTALRSNRVELTSISAVLSCTSELRVGELTGPAGTVRAQDIAPHALDGQDIVVFVQGDATFSGSVVNTPGIGATGDGNLGIRGFATQTLDGVVSVNDDVTVGHGSGLVLSGSASLGTATGGSIVLRGGRFALDNRPVNNPNRLRDAGSSSTGLDTVGGGSFSLIGNAAGSTETVGRLQLGSQLFARSGALEIDVTHTAGGAAATVLTFASYSRHSGGTPRDTVDFTAHDDLDGVLPLGLTGNNPRIIIGGSVNLKNSLISRSNSTADDSVGWATVNGADFATHGPNGIAPVLTVAFPAVSSPTTNALLTDNFTVNSATPFALNSLRIAPTAAGQSMSITGAGGLSTNAILLAGDTDYAISNSGGGTGGIVGPGGARYFQVQNAVLTVDVSLGIADSSAKGGAGTLVLTNVNNAASTRTLTINEGVVRATPGSSLTGGKVELRGGVLEIVGGGTFNRTLGSANGQINWRGDLPPDPPVDPVGAPGESDTDRGSGGFSAFGSAATVDLNSIGPDAINVEIPWFVGGDDALLFGSTRSDASLTWIDNLSLSGTGAVNYNLREFQVADNPLSGEDFTRLSGVISGSTSNDLLKTGPGSLELTGQNDYLGGTVVAEGALLFNNGSALGAVNGAYVLLGGRSGAATTSLLASHSAGSITLARDLHIQTGTSGPAVLGNTIAPDASAAADVTFSGEVVLGNHNSVGYRVIRLVAQPASTVTFSGKFTPVVSYGGVMDIEKAGGGTVVLTAVNDFQGELSVNEGGLHLNAAQSVARLHVEEAAAKAVLNFQSDAANLVRVYDGGRGPGAVVSQAAIDEIWADISVGYNAGLWNGNGIGTTMVADADANGLGLVLENDADDAGFLGIREMILGDANADDFVDVGDATVLFANLGQDGTWLTGDANYDGFVNSADATVLFGHLGQSFDPGLSPAAVPEPAAGLLALIGLTVFAAGWKFRRLARLR